MTGTGNESCSNGAATLSLSDTLLQNMDKVPDPVFSSFINDIDAVMFDCDGERCRL